MAVGLLRLVPTMHPGAGLADITHGGLEPLLSLTGMSHVAKSRSSWFAVPDRGNAVLALGLLLFMCLRHLRHVRKGQLQLFELSALSAARVLRSALLWAMHILRRSERSGQSGLGYLPAVARPTCTPKPGPSIPPARRHLPKGGTRLERRSRCRRPGSWGATLSACVRCLRRARRIQR